MSLFSKSVKQEVGVEGMKCEGCEANVEKHLKEIDGVKSVKADRTKKTAVVVSKEGISEADAKAAVEAANKTFTGIKTL